MSVTIMSFIVDSLVGERIEDVLVDSEVTYIMLANGTQITIRGFVVVQPRHSNSLASGLSASASSAGD
jgi:hypothetical protein